METPIEQTQPTLPKQQRIYAANKSNCNINDNNNDAKYNINIGKSDSAEKSNKSVSPCQFENDYQSITEWNQRALAAKSDPVMEERKSMLDDGRISSETSKTHKVGDCSKMRAKGMLAWVLKA